MKKESLKCPYCDYTTTSDRKGKCLDSLFGHLKRAHSISKKQLESSGDIDVSYFNDKKEHDAEKNRKRLRDPEYVKKQNEKLKTTLGDDEYNKLPECKICGFRGKQLYKHVFVVWHSDVKRNIYRELRKCKEFLES